MAHAKIENNKVVNVLETRSDKDIAAFEGLYVNLEKFPNAQIGDTYDPVKKIIVERPPNKNPSSTDKSRS